MWFEIASFVLTAAQGAQTASAKNELSEQNRDAAVTSQTYENASLNEQVRQQDEIDADKKLQAIKDVLKADGQLQAMDKKVTGGLEGTRREIQNNLGTFFSQLEANKAGRYRQLEMDKKGTQAKAQSRINASPKASYNPLQDVAKTGLSIYGDFKDAQRQMKIEKDKDITFGDYAKGDWWK